MIRKLTIRGFKSIKEAEIPLGPFTVFIGPNASGKSNILEAIRVVQGLALGYPVRDVLDGRQEEATRARWPGVRGGSRYAAFVPAEGSTTQSTLELGVEVGEGVAWRGWTVAVDPTAGIVTAESLHGLAKERAYYDAPAPQVEPRKDALVVQVDRGPGAKGGRRSIGPVSHSLSVLTQFRGLVAGTESNEKIGLEVARALGDLQFLDPSPDNLRDYSQPGARRLGERGERFASVVETISKDEASRKAFVGWLESLTPTHISDLHFFRTDLGEVMFGVKENGLPVPIPAKPLSDGTLRFAVIAAALFQPDPPTMLLVEEVENGVNATRLHLLADLLRQLSAKARPQVLVTTHSPLLLAYLPEEAYENVIWCWRDEEDGSTCAMPITQVPHFKDVIARTPLGELFAKGWLESAL